MLRRLRDWNQARRDRVQARKAVEQIRNRPVPTPGQIAEAAALAPRDVRRSHKLAVRRSYRCRALVMDSRSRQILAQSFAAPFLLEQLEAESLPGVSDAG